MSNLEHLGAEDSFCTKLYQCRTGELHRFCGKPFQFYWFWCAHCGLHQSSEATWKSSLLSRLEAEWSCLRHPGCSLARKMLARVGKLCQRNGETQWNTGMKVSPLQFGTSWHISFFSHVLSWLRKRSVHMERPESKEIERKWSRNAGADTARWRSNLADLWLGDTAGQPFTGAHTGPDSRQCISAVSSI